MSILPQIGHLLALLLATHRARPRDSLLVAAGFVITAATLAVMLAVPAGIDRIAQQTGQEDIVLAISGGASDEVGSSLSSEQVALISALPQVAHSADARPLAAPQFLANTKLTQSDGQRSTVLVRGVTAETWAVLDPARLHVDVQPQEGLRQLSVSRMLARQFPELGQPRIALQGGDWQVVGHLDANGNLWESELWTDLAALQAAYNRPGRVSSVWLKLDSPEQMPALEQAVRSDPRLQDVRVVRQIDYYQQQVGFVSRFVRIAAAGISVLMGAGAVLAISTTLGMALDKRRREMATLRALGFNNLAVGGATLLDVLMVGVLATLGTVLLVRFLLDGASFGTSSVNQAVYAHFVIDASVIGIVLAYSLLLGLVSSVLPLRRIMKGKLVDALKD